MDVGNWFMRSVNPVALGLPVERKGCDDMIDGQAPLRFMYGW